MKKTTVITIALFFLTGFGFADAGELIFPKTEAEIVKALTIKDGQTVFQGAKYESQEGRVYKVVNDKRYRIRGLQGIVDSAIVPKAGALINFNHDSTKIRPGSYSWLDEYGKALKGGLANAVLIIAGHTDNSGTLEYNQKLSEERAQSVTNYLIAHHGISTYRLIVKGYGETKPIKTNDNEAGRFINRRVEFIRAE